MMEAYKRELVREWCAHVPLTFVPTVNNNAKPAPGDTLWFTIVWEPDDVQRISYCGVMQETGQLAVIVAGEPNAGDAAVAEGIDAVVAALMLAVDPLSALTLEGAGATVENSAGTADRWYSLRAVIDYRLIFEMRVQPLPGPLPYLGESPPEDPDDNRMWWNSSDGPGGGALYIYYNDGTSRQWVAATPVPSA